MPKNVEEIKQKIMEGYKNGVCDKDGDSGEKDGRAIAKARNISSSVTFRKIYPYYKGN